MICIRNVVAILFFGGSFLYGAQSPYNLEDPSYFPAKVYSELECDDLQVVKIDFTAIENIELLKGIDFRAITLGIDTRIVLNTDFRNVAAKQKRAACVRNLDENLLQGFLAYSGEKENSFKYLLGEAIRGMGKLEAEKWRAIQNKNNLYLLTVLDGLFKLTNIKSVIINTALQNNNDGAITVKLFACILKMALLNNVIVLTLNHNSSQIVYDDNFIMGVIKELESLPRSSKILNFVLRIISIHPDNLRCDEYPNYEIKSIFHDWMQEKGFHNCYIQYINMVPRIK